MAYALHRPETTPTYELVKQGLSLVETSGVLPLLEGCTSPQASGPAEGPVERPADSAGDEHGDADDVGPAARPRRGRPPTREKLTVSALLTLIYVLSRRNRNFTWAALVGLIFGELDEPSRQLLGMTAPYWSDETRRAQIAGRRSEGLEVAELLSGPERARAKTEFHQLANQMGAQCNALLSCIDTTTMSVNKKHSLADLQASQDSDEDLDARAALRDEVVYRLIRAGLVLGNRLNYGHDDLREGIFRGWDGHLGVDETKVRVSTGMHAGAVAPALQLARQTGHDRLMKHPDVVGVQCIIAVSGSSAYTVPTVCLGATITEPGTDVTGPVLSGIDLIQRIDPDLIPPVRTRGSGKRGARHRYVVGDKAYPQAVNLNAGLIDRNFSFVGLPLTQQRASERLRETGSKSTEGPVLAKNGAVMCPGVSARRLAQEFEYPERGATREQREAHARQEAYLAAFKMGTKWRLPQLLNAEPGRPKVGVPPTKQYKLQVACPASEGRVLCPLVKRADEEERAMVARGIPSVEVADLPRGEHLPTCCPGKSSVVVFDDSGTKKGVKYWQPLMAGSSKHWAIYNPSRGRTESYFSVLKSSTGANFNQGRTEWKHGSMWSLAAAMSVVESNLRFITAFVEKAAPPEEATDSQEESRGVESAA